MSKNRRGNREGGLRNLTHLTRAGLEDDGAAALVEEDGRAADAPPLNKTLETAGTTPPSPRLLGTPFPETQFAHAVGCEEAVVVVWEPPPRLMPRRRRRGVKARKSRKATTGRVVWLLSWGGSSPLAFQDVYFRVSVGRIADAACALALPNLQILGKSQPEWVQATLDERFIRGFDRTHHRKDSALPRASVDVSVYVLNRINEQHAIADSTIDTMKANAVPGGESMNVASINQSIGRAEAGVAGCRLRALGKLLSRPPVLPNAHGRQAHVPSLAPSDDEWTAGFQTRRVLPAERIDGG
ncbi:hypothetical protein C8F01DRAFT_1088820 [Mycena amicta]|nr:hypothetical protein C8F01DRAFT_1088820 [Mycena amicta]